MKIAQISAPAFWKKGLVQIPAFLSPEECKILLQSIEQYQQAHPIPLVKRMGRRRNLIYKVIDGWQIKQYLPAFQPLYDRIHVLANQLYGQPLIPLPNERVAINLNLTPKGGAYRWHYDRNQLTAILYLNQVKGGETECYPRYRIRSRFARLQLILDRILLLPLVRRLFGRYHTIPTETGKLALMLGNTCLHSVTEVQDETDRVTLICSYDVEDPDRKVGARLDTYLYEESWEKQEDPNYRLGKGAT